MPAMNQVPQAGFLPTTEAQIALGPIAKYEGIYDLRVTNVTSAAADCRMAVTNGTITGYLCYDKSVAAKDTIDIYLKLALTTGWNFTGRGSATDTLNFLITGRKNKVG